MRKVLVTGASEGIGRAFALAFAREGYEVSAVARNEARLESLVQEIGSERCKIIVADLSATDGLKTVSDLIATSGFDVVVNNAGLGHLGEFSRDEFVRTEQMLKLNIESLVELSGAFLKSAKPGSALINVASVLSFLPSPYHAIYAATKAFVKSFSEGLWFEQKQNDVYVMALCPGSTRTEFNARAGGDANRIPKFMVQSSDDVVHIAMRELKRRRKPVVITGFHNRAIVFLTRLLPARFVLASVGEQNKKFLR